MRGADHMLSEKSQWTQNGTMFVDLDWPLNASRRLSASAELLVCRPDALPVAQPTVSKHWRENMTFHGRAYPKLTWVFQLCLWPLRAPDYLGEWLPCLSSALWCQYSREKLLYNTNRKPYPVYQMVPWLTSKRVLRVCQHQLSFLYITALYGY